MKKIILDQVKKIPEETFQNTSIPDSIENLQINDFDEWDYEDDRR
mgnify:CR=1 FL=1